MDNRSLQINLNINIESETRRFFVNPAWTIGQLKEHIQTDIGHKTFYQIIIYKGRQLPDNAIISIFLDPRENPTLYLVLRHRHLLAELRTSYENLKKDHDERSLVDQVSLLFKYPQDEHIPLIPAVLVSIIMGYYSELFGTKPSLSPESKIVQRMGPYMLLNDGKELNDMVSCHEALRRSRNESLHCLERVITADCEFKYAVPSRSTVPLATVAAPPEFVGLNALFFIRLDHFLSDLHTRFSTCFADLVTPVAALYHAFHSSKVSDQVVLNELCNRVCCWMDELLRDKNKKSQLQILAPMLQEFVISLLQEELESEATRSAAESKKDHQLITIKSRMVSILPHLSTDCFSSVLKHYLPIISDIDVGGFRSLLENPTSLLFRAFRGKNAKFRERLLAMIRYLPTTVSTTHGAAFFSPTIAASPAAAATATTSATATLSASVRL